MISEGDDSCGQSSSRKGPATFTLKKSISGPMKNAVTIVPIPTTPVICVHVIPAVRQRHVPAVTHIRSLIILQNRNGTLLCRSETIKEIASYVDTPRSAVK